MWKKGSSLEDEVSRDDFDPSVFIDRVFTRTSSEMRDTELDVSKLKSNFELIINNLQILRNQVNNKATLLQNKCKLSEQSFKNDLKHLQSLISKIDDQFQKLDENIHQVSGKVVLLGDQLERKSNPRNQLKAAKDIIFEFYKYINGAVNQNLNNEDEEEILLNAAEKIQKLSALCLELPDDATFIDAKNRVTITHEEIDQHLANRFKIEMVRENTDSMRRIVLSLGFSKKFSVFISSFIEQCVQKINIHQDLIGNLVSICSEYNKLIEIVFHNHYAVMLQLIQAIFAKPLKMNIEARIPSNNGELEVFLTSLYTNYVKLDIVIKQLSTENFIQDSGALTKLFKELFSPYLHDYIQYEQRWLEERLEVHLARYYESVNHQRRVLSNEGGFVDRCRDIQARFTTSSGSGAISHAGSEERDATSLSKHQRLLLSQEVAVNILEDVKASCKRCRTLSTPTLQSDNIFKIMGCLQKYLILNHLNYGIDICLQGLMSTDSKREPNLLFFQVVHEANNIFQFFDKVVSDTILPLISNPDRHSECVSIRQQILKDLETKINHGLEKLMQLCLHYVQHILATEQKKSDFRPENGVAINPTTSPAAEKVVALLRKLPPKIDIYLDGQNKEIFCQEFGLQFHRLLMDHFYSFVYSCEGGYIAMQDVNLYDEVMRKFKCPLLNRLFNTLLTLMNIVSMKQENTTSIISNHLANGIPKELLINFVNLRADQKVTRGLVDLK